MKTIRRLIYGEVLAAIALVALGFLALFFFFDLVDELQYLGKNNSLGAAGDIYQIKHALLYVALLIPNHLYELLPISVLIGTIFVMARLAQSSEYTILRTSGLGPWRALKLLLALGAFFAAFSFAVGDYLAPVSERAAQLLKARYQGKITIGQTGAWLKETQGDNTYVVNVKELSHDNKMKGIQIFEFNKKGLIVSTTQAPTGTFSADDSWRLLQASRADFHVPADAGAGGKAQEVAKVTRATLESFRWPTGISAEMVSVALLKPDRMATIDLFSYIRHLEANSQT
ncbi:MAG: LptF/LptG family permease, partial [Polaromonas sp.]|nr:LptF/LptG family permease [Polaromonas sp.]